MAPILLMSGLLFRGEAHGNSEFLEFLDCSESEGPEVSISLTSSIVTERKEGFGFGIDVC